MKIIAVLTTMTMWCYGGWRSVARIRVHMKSHTGWAKSLPWMTLNSHYALRCTNHASFGDRQGNSKEDRPILSATKV